jgi:hypothetical protein
METVKDWAAIRGFEYNFIDDHFLEYVPRWYNDKVKGQVQLVSDLARLYFSKHFLASGYDRTIWIDADVLIFNPQNFVIDTIEECAFCREVWMTQLVKPFLWFRYKVNNAVAIFLKNNAFLDFYIETCQSVIKSKKGKIPPSEVGTRLLTRLYEEFHFSLIRNVGLLSPLVLDAIVTGTRPILRKYVERFDSPMHAANLTLSYRDVNFQGVVMDDKSFNEIVESLLRKKGEVLNR